MPDSRPLVLYHGPNCIDGWTAAWVAWKRFGDSADYAPVNYGQPLPDVAGRDVYILDFSYPRSVLLEMAGRARVVVLDHHETAKADLANLEQPGLFIRFDMEHSGARLAWDYFFPGKPAPWLVDYVEDRDLWRFERIKSRAINAALASHKKDFGQWSLFASLSRPPQGLIHEGEGILRYQDEQIEKICHNAYTTSIAGYDVLCANTPVLQSEVAGKLAEGKPFGVAWYLVSDGPNHLMRYSLRSDKNGLNVADIARSMGGGGHRQAAGFEVSVLPMTNLGKVWGK